MNRTLDNIKFAFGIVGCFVVFGLVASGFWWLFELFTNNMANLFKLAGY